MCVLNRVTETPIEPDKPEEEPGESESPPKLLEIEPLSASNLLFAFDKPVDIDKAVFSISDIGATYLKKYVDAGTKQFVKHFFRSRDAVGPFIRSLMPVFALCRERRCRMKLSKSC